MDLVTTWKLTVVLHCYTSQIRAVVSGTECSQCRINLYYTARQPHFNYFSSSLLYMGPLGNDENIVCGLFPSLPPPPGSPSSLGNAIPDFPHRWGTPPILGETFLLNTGTHSSFLGVWMAIQGPGLTIVQVTGRFSQGITEGRTHVVGHTPRHPAQEPGSSSGCQCYRCPWHNPGTATAMTKQCTASAGSRIRRWTKTTCQHIFIRASV